MVFWNCSDGVVSFVFNFISTIFLWYFGIVPTEWYFFNFFLFLLFSYGILELFRRSGIFFYFYFFISTVFLWYFGTVPTEWYFLFLILFLPFF